MYFYPRSPCGERLTRSTRHETDRQFLSTLSLRRATLNRMPTVQYLWNFYPRSPCGERLAQAKELGIVFRISIHALLAESDFCFFLFLAWLCLFLSTLSLRRATLFTIGLNRAHGISIHALLAESDAAIFFLYCAFPYFYPRSPCGERRAPGYGNTKPADISIHALLAESDVRCRVGSVRPSNFYPRSPCGERLFLSVSSASAWQFLSTLSLRRATLPM